MRWSIPVMTVKGTETRIHLTFLLFLLWIGFIYYELGGTAGAFAGIGFILLLFLCVTLHEFGHILTARRFGIKTPRITLLPIGGISHMERFPDEPKREVAIALAGPAVNFVIAGLLIAAMGRLPRAEDLSVEALLVGQFLAPLAIVNLLIGAFNLLPAFPMDGGRVVRALLRPRMGNARATKVAGVLGQIFAVLFAIAGFLGGNIILIFIALFIFLAAAGESRMAQLAGAVEGRSAGEVMVSEFESLDEEARLADAADALIRTTQSEFPVVDKSGRLKGLLTRDRLIKGLSEHGAQSPVAAAMEQEVPTVSSSHEMDEVLRLIRQGRPAVGVTDREGALRGFITMRNLFDELLLSAARSAGRS